MTATAEKNTATITDSQRKKLHVLMNEAGLTDRTEALAWVSGILGVEISTRSDLTQDEASRLIDILADGWVRRTENASATKSFSVQEAVRRVTADIGQIGVDKGGTNAQQGYKFRGIDQFVNSLSPILARHGVILLPTCHPPVITEHPTSRGGTQFMVVMVVDWTIVGPNGDQLHATTIGQAMDASDKASNKAMSAAFKYLLAQVFVVPNIGWTDGDSDNPTVEGPPGFNRNSQPRPDNRQASAQGPTIAEIRDRISEFATNQSMTVDQFTERFRARHNNVSVEAMFGMPREMLLAFVRQCEEYQSQTRGSTP